MSRESGTLHFDAFAGYDFWSLAPDRPAAGTVRIESMTRKAVVATLNVHATAMYRETPNPPAEPRRLEVSRVGLMTFPRAKARARPENTAMVFP